MPRGGNHGVERHTYTTKWNKKDRLNLEIEIIKELGRVPTIREMQEKLYDRTGHRWSTSVIHSDLQSLDKVTVEQFEAEKNDLLSKLDAEIAVAHRIAMDSSEDNKIKLQAMKTMTALAKAKSDLLEVVGKITAEQNKKIIKYEIYLGEPEVVSPEELDENVEEADRENKDVAPSNSEPTS